MNPLLKFSSVCVLLFIGISLTSFQNNSTIHARLGKSKYYFDKPTDCIENVQMEKPYEDFYEVYPKNHKSGSCSFVFDKDYMKRITPKKDEIYFNDVILDKTVSVQEYIVPGAYYREVELVANGDYISLTCNGNTKEEIEKYYAVLKSLSTK